MRVLSNFGLRSWRRGGVVAAVLVLLVVGAAAPAAAQRWEPEGRSVCSPEGTWLSSVDIGAQFFTQYSAGDTATGGAITVEWITMDPTLFGTFPNAVKVTQAMGAWRQRTATTYAYTWVAYGLDSAGIPLYAIRGSGPGTFDGCDHIDFDWVMEVFPYPMNPLTDQPVACMKGTGSKDRAPVVQAQCEE